MEPILYINIEKYSRILAFDPGATTGICFLEKGVYRWGMIAIPSMFFREDFHRGIILASQPDTVVVEEPPHGGFPNKQQMDVFNEICRRYTTAGFDLHRILPAFWKKNTPTPDVQANSHIRDSIGMATWFYNRHGRGESSE